MPKTKTFAISVEEFRLVIGALEVQRDAAHDDRDEDLVRQYVRIIWKFEKLLRDVEAANRA